jgi:hypothetical protein
LAWDTLFPTIGPLPVTSHTRAMTTFSCTCDPWIFSPRACDQMTPASIDRLPGMTLDQACERRQSPQV